MRRFLPLVALLVLLVPAALSATKLKLDAVRVDGAEIRASVRVPGLFGPKTEARLSSGLAFETKIRFYLVAERNYWPDEVVAITNVVVSASYDAVRDEYTIVWRIKAREVFREVVRTTAEVRKRLETYPDLPVFPVDPKLRGENLSVEARAYLGVDYVLGLATEDWTDRRASAPFRLP